MEKEFNLDEKRSWIEAGSFKGWIYPEEDIKEFIKRLKVKLGVKAIGSKYAEEEIDKLAGDKLNGK